MFGRLVIFPYAAHCLYGQQCWGGYAVELSHVMLPGLSILQSPRNWWQE